MTIVVVNWRMKLACLGRNMHSPKPLASQLVASGHRELMLVAINQLSCMG